jgi:hypothetical protein
VLWELSSYDHRSLDGVGERRDKGLDADIISLQDAAAPIPLVIRQNGRAHDARGMVMRILQVGDGGAAKNIPRRNVSRPEPSYRTMIYLPSSLKAGSPVKLSPSSNWRVQLCRRCIDSAVFRIMQRVADARCEPRWLSVRMSFQL